SRCTQAIAASARPTSSACAAFRSLAAYPPPLPPMAITSSPCVCSSSRMRVRSATRRSAAGRTSLSALLASSGVNERSVIEPHRRDDRRRLALWLTLVAFFIVVQYASRASGGEETDPLYRWSFAVASLIQEAIFLLIVAAIAGFSPTRMGWRLPSLRWRTLGLAVAAFFAIQVFEVVYIAFAHPGNEQGLTPTQWQPSHAAQYIVNGLIVCTVVPFVEETTFRGLGFYLLRPYGAWFAILTT